MAADCRLYCAGTSDCISVSGAECADFRLAVLSVYVLDWFPVDWKISKGYADSDAKEIQAYAREIYNVYQLDQPLKQWLPNWFAAQAGFDKLLVLAGWAAIPVSAVLAVLGAVRAVRAGQVTVAPHVDGAVSEREIGAPLPARRVAHLTPLCFSLLQLCAVVGFSSGSSGRRWCGTDIFMCCFCR